MAFKSGERVHAALLSPFDGIVLECVYHAGSNSVYAVYAPEEWANKNNCGKRSVNVDARNLSSTRED